MLTNLKMKMHLLSSTFEVAMIWKKDEVFAFIIQYDNQEKVAAMFNSFALRKRGFQNFIFKHMFVINITALTLSISR